MSVVPFPASRVLINSTARWKSDPQLLPRSLARSRACRDVCALFPQEDQLAYRGPRFPISERGSPDIMNRLNDHRRLIQHDVVTAFLSDAELPL
jgi:hypothetical protein